MLFKTEDYLFIINISTIPKPFFFVKGQNTLIYLIRTK